MRRFLGFLMVIILSLFLTTNTKATTVYNDSNTVAYQTTNTLINDINGYATFTKESGITIRSNTNYPQKINVLAMKTSQDAKVVTWAIPNAKGDGFTRRPLADIAENYETLHPGWSVIGGINADQYATKYGQSLSAEGSDYFYPQPYYPMIADYEKWFSVPVLPYGAGNIVGFLNDGSVDQLVYYKTSWNYNGLDQAKIAGLFLSVINENGEVSAKHQLSTYNSLPLENESSLYTPYYTGQTCPPLEVNGSHVFVVEKADMAFASNSVTYTYKDNNGQNAFFGKGIISSLVTNATLASGSFAINTKNQALINDLKIGSYIKVQFEYDNALNDCEAGIGFHTVMRTNGLDVASDSSYNTRAYPRSIFGRKADGEIVLMTIDGSNSAPTTGATQQEAHAILKKFGVVEAYQMDGGGSVTMIAREAGQIQTVNNPAEGEARHIFSALLFVVRDLNVQTTAIIALDQVTLQIHLLDQTLGQLFVRLNNESKEVINNTVTFTNLKANTTYQYEYIIYYEGVYKTYVKTGVIKTIKVTPFVKSCHITIYDNEMYFEVDIYDPNSALLRKNLQYLDKSYTINKKQVLISDYHSFTLTELKIVLSYDLNDEKGRIDEANTDFLIICDIEVILQSARNTTTLALIDLFK